MPYIYTEIEKRKNWTIWVVFVFLVFFYFVIAEIVWVLTIYFFFTSKAASVAFSAHNTLKVLAISFIIAAFHWFASLDRIIEKIINVLGAEEPDSKDYYHNMFKNIVEEVRIATGGHKMMPYVVPIMGLNAFAVSDLRGNSIIGVTEGLLVKLNRGQLESVVAHEAAHIVSGDSLSATITCSLFGIYSALMEKIKTSLKNTARSVAGISFIVLYLSILVTVLYIAQAVNFLLNMFLSRQKEYRADAIAVRLTRDPVALAEALYIISRRSCGVGFISSSLAPIFIVNPEHSALEESEGLIPNMFSTHPPIMKRADILLSMAHSDIRALIGSDAEKTRVRLDGTEKIAPPLSRSWFIRSEGAWQGPFFVEELLGFGLNPGSWVSRAGDNKVWLAAECKEINGILKENINEKLRRATDLCPRCAQPLVEDFYEGAAISRCYYCKGILAHHNAVKRIFVREIADIPDAVKRAAVTILKNYSRFNFTHREFRVSYELSCPNCGSKMMKGFYSLAYPVEVDRCISCGYIWFDKDELETLQCLIEKIS